nr:MAG: SIR2 family protein [Candidatus Methanoperedens sp.]
MVQNYTEYIKNVSNDIEACLDSKGCQPILFIGSGLSKRYFGGPSWEELLKILSERCPGIDKDFAYYKQSYGTLRDIGEVFAEIFKEWAWGSGKSEFPIELFDSAKPSNIYLKYKAAKYFESITPESIDAISDATFKDEIKILQNIRPHAIITTNYDRFLEKIFPEYEPIIGQKILHTNNISIGEIFKIHGCISEPESMVLTEKDYIEFMAKKKYLSAKLLTYFAEHPLLFIGYSAEDPNIKSILSDIDEIISSNNELIPNIYILEWKSTIFDSDYPQREKLISIDGSRTVRIKSITSSSFIWILKAFSVNGAIEKVNPKLLRGLLARTYELVRHDIPKKSMEVDYQTLEHAINTEGELARIYGITPIHDPKMVNAAYPYSLTQVAEKLGYGSWHNANKLIERIFEEKAIDIKTSDNRYQITIKAGNINKYHKYSNAVVDLLKKVRDNEEYEITFDE